MDPSDDEAFRLFLEVYGTLPRAGPGGDEHTVRALGSVPGPTPRTVLDLGCGPGAQTVALGVALPAARIVAVDLLAPMAEETRRRIIARGVEGRVVAVVGDMAAPPIAPGSQDLIWSEGAIYNLGVTEALRAWRPLLRPGGTVAFTEPVWLVDSPPREIHDWWMAEYPAITDAAGVRTRIAAASYRVVASFDLPASAWWDEFYAPMQDRIDDLRSRRPHDPVAHGVVAGAEAEIDHFRRFSDAYTYAFFIVQPTG
ncbi:MAG TPA: methyltransferase domain-containing protein [Acidimicrobiales bacterium]|nr:methyltransferase domain-containing protein [Acidimicrobiales bacterium]